MARSLHYMPDQLKFSYIIMHSPAGQENKINRKSDFPSINFDPRPQQDVRPSQKFYLYKKSQSESKFSIRVYQNVIEDEEQIQYEDDPDIAGKKIILQFVKKQMHLRLAIIASMFQQFGNLPFNKLHFTRKVDKIRTDRRNMVRQCQLCYALACYHLSKLFRMASIQQSIKNHVAQYVIQIEEDRKDRMELKQGIQRQFRIYLQRTQFQALDKSFREFRILLDKKPSHTQQDKVNNLYLKKAKALKST